jgi:hypothetical protein
LLKSEKSGPNAARHPNVADQFAYQFMQCIGRSIMFQQPPLLLLLVRCRPDQLDAKLHPRLGGAQFV